MPTPYERPGRRRRGWKTRLALGVAGIAVLLAVAAGAVVYRAVSGRPDVAVLASAAPRQTVYMRLRAGEEGRPAGAYRVGTLPLDRVSPLLLCAVVKSEDHLFFRHRGVDWAQVRRAVFRTAVGAPMGGSTITQQVARNFFLGPARTLERKVREVSTAQEMERTLHKRRILELYLNSVEWGDGVWGAEAASRHYLGVDAGRVDAFGAALLAALVPAPRQPLAGRNRLRAERVQHRVLDQLLDSDLLTRAEWVDAQVRTDTLHARLRRGLPLPAALPGPRDGVPAPGDSAPGAPLTVASVVASECGLPRELGER